VKLTQVRGPLQALKPKVAFFNTEPAKGREARDRWHTYRAWYKTARWHRLRWQVLARDLFTCQMCGRLEGNTSQMVADHKVPHRGDEALFWDEGNIQCLCKACHDSAKQKEEAAVRRA
jgi:5-methylcytosine-specific restriction enzyme A